MKLLFDLGFVTATRGVLVIYSPEFIGHLLLRHARGDWGDLSPEDQKENEKALKHGGRIFSSYRIGDDYIFIITYPGRYTTVMMADEY